MLPEKIYYPHDFPLTITIAELNEVPLHYIWTWNLSSFYREVSL